MQNVTLLESIHVTIFQVFPVLMITHKNQKNNAETLHLKFHYLCSELARASLQFLTDFL